MAQGSNKWRKGPELPYPVHGSAMVDHPNGGVVLIGGKSNGKTIDSIFYLSNAGKDSKCKSNKTFFFFLDGRPKKANAFVPGKIFYSLFENKDRSRPIEWGT